MKTFYIFLSCLICYIAIVISEQPNVSTYKVKKRVRTYIKDTCNACAIHRIYGLKNATPHYKYQLNN